MRIGGVVKWWNKMIFPVKRVLVSFAARVKARKNGGGLGLLKLHDDVQMCGYQDVQVMWEMLKQSEMEMSHSPKRKRPFWRIFVWSNRTTTNHNSTSSDP
ncbi:hypothetical protein QJS04_geneDACA013905 [Acorus gramineus]|uniref:Uncharacterized protein n=1 Tax=Acorus gramineus TaxID=55184 RepID=A0AAV9AXB7_ACOGR|nr:hypothetical protein QJS04_geneDACA013905 [Acorus gramineus]